MKKLSYLFALMILSLIILSCNPEVLDGEARTELCCGENGQIPPPPPPPPTGSDE